MSKKIYNNAIDLIGSTPMVRINKIPGLTGGNVYAKMELFNPGGSIKDRICLSKIDETDNAKRQRPADDIAE